MNLPGRASMERSKRLGQKKSRAGGRPRKFLPGKRFGILTITRRLDTGRVECRCDCGNTYVAWTANLDKHFTVSCGCLKGSHKVNAPQHCLLAEAWR